MTVESEEHDLRKMLGEEMLLRSESWEEMA